MSGLNSQEAQRLVDLVVEAQDVEAAVAAAGKAFTFLVGQLHILGDAANGYPKNSIEGAVWKEGYELASVCDRFTDAVARWQQRRGEEQASRLAATMAMQVVAHYPEEIFPRILRNARCCEALGMVDEAVSRYRCIIDDFAALDLAELLEEPGAPADTRIFGSLRDALTATQRLAPQSLADEHRELGKRLDAILGTTVI